MTASPLRAGRCQRSSTPARVPRAIQSVKNAAGCLRAETTRGVSRKPLTSGAGGARTRDLGITVSASATVSISPVTSCATTLFRFDQSGSASVDSGGFSIIAVQEAAERALKVYRVIGSPGYRLNEGRVADVARRSFARGNDPAGVARQYAAIVVSPDRSPGLRALTIPTLVIHGEDDPLVEVDGGLAIAKAVPGARLVVVPGMGHDLPQQLWPRLVDEIVTNARARA